MTVFATACLGLLLVLGAALGVVAAMFVGHRTAQAAADLSALAAAGAVGRGEDPCGVAAEVAGRNRGDLTTCEVSGLEVVVTVTVPGPGWLGQTGDLQGQARAGPVTAPQSGHPR
ncbi:Rv3654c family TadE-like protein [Nocardioides insulae]|uniref:Rv3654c family TadE-like protein n=1 Tax=Nocardioides insulae TaxID=394734 RepID=UPI000406B202|nr:Rv3654c family TadE-like protein [Nocardioides insulae]